ncbi:MAG: hypothetical protein Q8P05_00985 [Candidatus Diapherotrites archaeon]|nr:hypothetical protein [Candidatus Diapherotrites archaeon]
MVKKINDLYQCVACELLYKEKGIAESCQSWCQTHHSCNLQIIQLAVKKE